MQDYDAKMEGTQIQIKGLFIDSPGENTIDLNKDHFVKRERIQSLCKSCTASALFTLQTNAPSVELGMTSIRGGGPLTLIQADRLISQSEGSN